MGRAGQLRRPELAGAHGELNAALHRLHLLAGRPSLSEVAFALRGAGVSRSTVHDAFCSARLPKWKVIDALVEVLSSQAPGGTPEEDQKVLHEVWLRAAQESDQQPAAGPQTAELREMEINKRLQQALLPQQLPQLNGVEVACRYLPASAADLSGGDWFDVIPLDETRTAFVVGDVMAKSTLGIAVMAQLRSELSTLVRRAYSSDQALNRMADQAGRLLGEQLATCICAIYDSRTRLLDASSAGHIPPFLLRCDGTGFLADLPTGLPIGMGVGACEAVTYEMSPGETLFLFTDGVVMSPKKGLEPGLSRLRTSLLDAQTPAGSPVPLEDLIDAPLRALATHRHDDAALLAARFS